MTPQLILGVIALTVTVLVQFGTIIWFASKVSATMQFQATALARLSDAVKAMEHFMSAMEARMAVLEDRHERPA
jgi:hypothetical protein